MPTSINMAAVPRDRSEKELVEQFRDLCGMAPPKHLNLNPSSCTENTLRRVHRIVGATR